MSLDILFGLVHVSTHFNTFFFHRRFKCCKVTYPLLYSTVKTTLGSLTITLFYHSKYFS